MYCGIVRCITDGSFTIYCCEIIVDSEFRGRGIGTGLLRIVQEQWPACSIDVLSDNDAFYKANGVLVLCNGMRKP